MEKNNEKAIEKLIRNTDRVIIMKKKSNAQLTKKFVMH